MGTELIEALNEIKAAVHLLAIVVAVDALGIICVLLGRR